MQSVAAVIAKGIDTPPPEQFAVVRMPKHHLTSVLTILKGLESTLPDASEILETIEILQQDGPPCYQRTSRREQSQLHA